VANLGRVRQRSRAGRATYWYVDLRPHGEVYTVPSPTGPIPIRDRALAERVLESIRSAIAGGKTIPQALAPWLSRVAPEMRFAARYEVWLTRQDLRVATEELRASYVRELRRYGKGPSCYLAPLAHVPVGDLCYRHLEELDATLVARVPRISPATRRKVFDAVRGFMRWLRKIGDLHAVPEVPTVRVTPPDPRLLTPAQQRAVLDAIPEARRGIFITLAFHGLRPGEACRLDVADLDFGAGVIRLRPRKAKTRQARAIPCSPELRAWIHEHVEAAGRLVGAALFQNPRARVKTGRRWNSWTLWDTWRTACRAAKVPEVSLYCGTKHSTATAARRAGVPLETIQLALGHADRRSTERYARAADLAPVEVLQRVESTRRERETG
jgi:integrase